MFDRFLCFIGLHKWDAYQGHRRIMRKCLRCGKKQREIAPGIFMGIALLCIITLSGCGGKAASEIALDAHKKQIDNVERTVQSIERVLPQACSTVEVLSLIESANSQIQALHLSADTILNTCNIEKDVLKQKITIRDGVIIFLGIVIFGLLIWIFRRQLKFALKFLPL